MNQILDLLAKRRSVKPFELHGPGPTPAELQQLLTIAARVPDHGKLSPWRFIVLEGAGRVKAGKALADVLRSKNPNATEVQIDYEEKRFLYAPLVVIVVSCAAPHAKIPLWEQELSAGAVCMNLTVAATGVGYRTTWITDWIAYDDGTKAALGVQAAEKIAGFIHIGHADHEPADRERPDIAKLTTRYL